MKKACVIILLLISLLCFAGCQSLQHFFQKPTVAFNTIEIKDMTLHDATAIFYFDVSNPNPVGGTLNQLTYDLKVDQKSIISGTADKGFNIPAETTETVELPVAINYFDIIESVTELIIKNEIAYDLSGSFNLMGFNLPYHTSGKLPIPKLPGITVKEVSVTDLSWAGAALDFVLELENNNSFAVTLNGLKYDISMGGKSFVSGTTQTDASIPKNGKTLVNIPFNINFIWLGKSAYDVLAGESTEYEVNGEMIFNVPDIGEKRFPFNKAGNVSLLK